MSDETQNTLVQDISNIIASKSQIAYLKNCVSEGSFYNGKGYITKGHNYYSDATSRSWIRLMRLNKVGLKRYFDYQSSYGRYHDDRSSFLNIFNSLYNAYERYGSNNRNELYLGCNIDRNITMMGYHYNINDIYSSYCFERNNNGRNEMSRLISDNIYKLIYISNKNFLIAMIDKQGILYMDSVLLSKLKENNEEKYREIVIKILSVYANANSVFFSLNTDSIDQSLINYIGRYLYTRLNNESKDCTIIPTDHIDLFNDSSQVQILVSKLQDMVTNAVDVALRDTRWGVNNQYSYKKLLDEVISSKDYSIQKLCEKSFYQGLQLGTKFELAGWQLSDQYNNNGVAWEKSVDIVPNKFCYQRKIYTIRNNDPDFTNPYRITKLFVTGEGVMYCEGRHPNVSSGHVCMGDIAGKIVMSDINELQKNLSRCEQLLYLINYDSPYQGDEMQRIRDDIIAHHSDMSAFDKVFDDEFVGDGDIVTDIQYEDSTPSEINPEMQPPEDDSNVEL